MSLSIVKQGLEHFLYVVTELLGVADQRATGLEDSHGVYDGDVGKEQRNESVPEGPGEFLPARI